MSRRRGWPRVSDLNQMPTPTLVVRRRPGMATATLLAKVTVLRLPVDEPAMPPRPTPPEAT